MTDTIYSHRPSMYFKGITPQEIDGLQAVLRLVITVAKHDSFSRLALCEHPSWMPMNIFLGLVTCSVPITLKASLLQTLGALANSREMTIQMWEYIEAAQILVTVPSTSAYQSRGEWIYIILYTLIVQNFTFTTTKLWLHNFIYCYQDSLKKKFVL